MGQFAVILPAAGRSSRFNDPRRKKVYAELEGRAVWLHALDPFLTHGEVEQIIVAIAPEDRELFDRRYHDKAAFLNLEVVEGGAERSSTVSAALRQVRPVCEFVAIHDAARPCLTTDQVSAVFAAAREHGAALLAIPVSDTVKRAGDDQFVSETLDRRGLFLAQTPQVFRRDWLEQAYSRAKEHGQATDDAQLVAALGHRCAIVPGSPLNLKITTQDDLRVARAILRLREQEHQHQEAGGHPFADEAGMWADTPRLKPSDVFGS